MKPLDLFQMKNWWTRLDEAIARQVNIGLAGRKEFLMACTNTGEFNGVPLCNEEAANSNVIFVPENCPHSYDSEGNAIFYAWPDGVGDPPAENQAPGSHANPPLVWGEPKAVFNSSGVCTSAGYAPGNIYYEIGDQSGSPSNPQGPNRTSAIAAVAVLNQFFAGVK